MNYKSYYSDQFLLNTVFKDKFCHTKLFRGQKCVLRHYHMQYALMITMDTFTSFNFWTNLVFYSLTDSNFEMIIHKR